MLALALLAYALPPEPLVLEKGPVVSDVTASEVEVRWEPPLPGAVLVVGSGGAMTVEVPAEVLSGVQRARAGGLRPDTLHRFRIRAGGRETGAGSFRTFPLAGQPVSFIVFGDTRSDHATHARVVERIATESADFLVSTGDLVADGRVARDWELFFRTANPLLRTTPFFPAIGNHDARGVLHETMIDRWFTRADWYEVRAGDVLLLFLDTTLSYGGGSAQRRWLRERLEAARASIAAGEASWIVVVHHHPAFSSARHGSEKDVQHELVPLYEEYGVDLVLTGHDHVYERLERNGTTYLVTGGGGAPLYEFKEALPESRVRARSYHYVRVTADAGRLALEAVDLDGNILDRHEILPRESRPRRKAVGGERAAPVMLTSAALFLASGAAAWVIARRVA